jgi:Fur family transcriptional regulator, zinc uptake regulator
MSAHAHDHAPTAAAAPHDHAHCVADALTRADALCAERGARLTILRRRVLELVWSSHRPRGAYAILEDLSQQDGKATAPLTVYRALEFLVEQGLVHRIESLNAYVGCAAPGASHSGQFLVCEGCGDAAEIDDPSIRSAIDDAAAVRGFRVQRPTVEVRGVCKDCQEKHP